MTTPNLKQRWYRALYYEDCVQLMQLLEIDYRLLKMGWKEDPLRYDGGTQWEPSSDERPPIDSGRQWTGRTALHAGAIRGCVDLIKQVLLLCDLKEVSDYHIVYEQGETDMVSTPGESALAKTEGAERNAPNIAADDALPDDDTQARGDQQGGLDRGQAERIRDSPHSGLRVKFQKAVSAVLTSNRLVQGKRKEKAHLATAQYSFVHVKEKEILEKEILTPEQSDGDFDSFKHPADAKVAEDDGGNLDTISGGSLSQKDRKELISAKDGEYGLNALEMAALQCNIDIIVLLVYAYSQCGLNGGRKHPLSPKIADTKDRADSQNRARLRLVTAESMDTLDDVGRSRILESYATQKDFNFLPLEGYLSIFCALLINITRSGRFCGRR